MDRIPISVDMSRNEQDALNKIMDGASNVPIILDTEPTTVNNILNEGQRGFFNGNLYETINGNTYKFTGILM